MRSGRSFAVAAVVAGALCLPAPASGQTPGFAAAVLRGDPVFVWFGAHARLPEADQSRLRARIRAREPGRIHVVVVSVETTERYGGVSDYANAIDRELDRRGTLLVVAGNDAWVVVSYPTPERAVAAVRAAFAAHPDEPLEAALLDAVDRLAVVDPGRRGDLRGGESPGAPAPGLPGDSGDDGPGVPVWLLVVGGALLLSLPLAVLAGRRRRRRDAMGAPVVSTSHDAQRREAEKAFGSEE